LKGMYVLAIFVLALTSYCSKASLLYATSSDAHLLQVNPATAEILASVQLTGMLAGHDVVGFAIPQGDPSGTFYLLSASTDPTVEESQLYYGNLYDTPLTPICPVQSVILTSLTFDSSDVLYSVLQSSGVVVRLDTVCVNQILVWHPLDNLIINLGQNPATVAWNFNTNEFMTFQPPLVSIFKPDLTTLILGPTNLGIQFTITLTFRRETYQFFTGFYNSYTHAFVLYAIDGREQTLIRVGSTRDPLALNITALSFSYACYDPVSTACSDGNTRNGDGCSSSCILEVDHSCPSTYTWTPPCAPAMWIAPCVLYGCPEPLYGKWVPRCQDINSNSSLALGDYSCLCPPGMQVRGLEYGQRFIAFKNTSGFPGCMDIECGNGVLGLNEECDQGLGCLPNCTCSRRENSVLGSVGWYWTQVNHWDINPNLTDCAGPFKYCGDGGRDIYEECDGGLGCLADCRCDRFQKFYPNYQDLTNINCARDFSEIYAIGHPDSFVFFFHNPYCNNLGMERRLTRLPWVTFSLMKCVDDPLDLGYMGLRQFPEATWDALDSLPFVVNYNSQGGVYHSLVNAESSCNRAPTVRHQFTSSPGAIRLEAPANSELNQQIYFDGLDGAENVRIRIYWDCQSLAAHKTCVRRLTLTNVSPRTLTNVKIQISSIYLVTPLVNSTSVKYGGQSSSSLLGYSGAVNDDIYPAFNTDGSLSPITSSDCWPVAGSPSAWINTGNNKAPGCGIGCSGQFLMSNSLRPGKHVSIESHLIIFPNTTVADMAVRTMQPAFYCLGSQNPPIRSTTPILDRQVLATFTYSPKEVSWVPGDCPCQNGGTCAATFNYTCSCDLTKFWGEYCEKPCLCKSGVCDWTTGQCTCPKGKCGRLCENTCDCTNGLCDARDCHCSCPSGWFGKDCSRLWSCGSQGAASQFSVKVGEQ